jgi:hypothetical protein
MIFIVVGSLSIVFVWVKCVGQLGVLLQFFVENYDNGVISYEFGAWVLQQSSC